ncbi:MAG TPA: outer membrane beta-barrel protein [Vicinamibacterales bacterium]|jgi:hypothetical protein|nr:outer membrane beta-barrel protein [Vicinamibacterales bacterium]
MRALPKLALAAASALCLLAATARPARAQEHAWEASLGYSALHDASDHANFPLGFSVSGALPLNEWLSAVGDIDHQRKTLKLFDGSPGSLTSTGFLAGVRASSTRGSFTEFVQALAGGVTSAGTVFGTTDTTHHFAVQPAIGLDVRISDLWAIRGELDARWLSQGNEVRYVAALVFKAPR